MSKVRKAALTVWIGISFALMVAGVALGSEYAESLFTAFFLWGFGGLTVLWVAEIWAGM